MDNYKPIFFYYKFRELFENYFIELLSELCLVKNIKLKIKLNLKKNIKKIIFRGKCSENNSNYFKYDIEINFLNFKDIIS